MNKAWHIVLSPFPFVMNSFTTADNETIFLTQSFPFVKSCTQIWGKFVTATSAVLLNWDQSKFHNSRKLLENIRTNASHFNDNQSQRNISAAGGLGLFTNGQKNHFLDRIRRIWDIFFRRWDMVVSPVSILRWKSLSCEKRVRALEKTRTGIKFDAFSDIFMTWCTINVVIRGPSHIT